ncbi:hypothetical protein FB451DRAFT_1526204, partial [Mycena latifolia]
DFFSAVENVHNVAHHQTDDTKSFAEAIQARFGQPDTVLTARLLPPALRMPSTPMANLSLQPAAPPPPPPAPTAEAKYTAVAPGALSLWLDDPRTLVVDIRPHAAYSSAHLSRAISLSVPSTLLKRPLFSLQRLSAMLPSRGARTRFSAWRSAPRILVYDADSAAISDTSNIQGLLRKFRAEAPDAPIALAWVQGGFQAVWSLRRDLVESVPPTPETETEDEDPEDDAQDTPQRVLRAHHLPRAAFALASTTQAPTRSGNKLPAPGAHAASDTHAFNPFFDTVRQNAELAHGITERIPLRLPRRVRRRIAELPFQWLRDIARRAAPVTPPPPSSSSASGGPSDSSSTSGTGRIEEGTEALAMQFYRIELAEQRRLMGVMEHHSRESGDSTSTSTANSTNANSSSAQFPFSITAGVEKGSKNRYRNIWPFEHARVRLHERKRGEEHDDYVNASYVQPLGTTRRYIATQGPLEATFADFWTLVWQQNTHLIVMLTREVEGAQVKCGAYWRAGTYGALRVELLGCAAPGCRGARGCSVCEGAGGAGDGARPGAGGFFVQGQGQRPEQLLIKRTLRLSHTGYPRARARTVVQLQYLGWPDMNVPEDARGVLGVVWEVGRVVGEVGRAEEERMEDDTANTNATAYAPNAYAADDKRDPDSDSDDSDVDGATGVLRRALRAGAGAAPVVLHCSAGVGRTGGFIAVDAVLDAVRREAREVYGGGGVHAYPAAQASVARVYSGEGEGMRVLSAGMRASGIGAEGGEDRMDVDVVDVDAEGRGMRTPMQVDSVELGFGAGGGADMGATRRWAERVADTRANTAAAFTFSPASVPKAFPSHPASAAAASFPSAATGSFPSSVASSSSYPSTAASSPFQFQPPAQRGFALTLPGTQRSLPETGTPAHPAGQNPETNSSSSSNAPQPGRVLLDRPLAKSPLPDRPRSLSPFGASAQTHRSMQSFDSASTGASADEQTQDGAARHVDYKEPRALHGRGGGAGPVRLSAFEDPIWEVLQDMREQRMSLCQSLRQYVFVHAAIIEGALMVVDEERARAGAAWRVPRQRPTLLLMPSADEGQSTTSSTGKRLASPTELPKEDTRGEIVLSKRPSLKQRKQTSADGYAPPLPTFPPP